MRKPYALLLFIVITYTQVSVAQTHILPKFVRKMFFEQDTSKRGSFIIIPVVTSAPETGLEVGGSALYSFYTDTVDRNTNISNIFAYATATTKSQTTFTLSSSYWLPHNRFHFIVNINYINFPFYFYGIGNHTHKANQDLIDQKRFKVNLGGETLVAKNLYLGFTLGGFDYQMLNRQPGGIFDADPAIEGRLGGAALLAGPRIVFDSRNNNTYTTKGLIITSYFNAMHGLFNNNSYAGGFWNTEYSQFFSLSKRLVLGVDVQEQSLTGSSSPFYLLPALGSDELMRGYYNGRYRDRNLLAGQTELRYRISDRLGLAAFTGTGEVFHSAFSFAELKPNYGAGIRYFFDVQKGLSVRLDYGIGEKRPQEPRQSGLYFAIGQSF